MPPKKKIPAPIDRPLSRAYLREFKGMSTAYPPGLSDPTSLRIMENIMIGRDGGARIRPGLKYLSYSADGDFAINEPVVGSHEAFYLDDGTKAILFAVREDDGTVGFRAATYDPDSGYEYRVYTLTDERIGFVIPQGELTLRLSDTTTYVKFLQIDNNIFALSDSTDAMRLFYVGKGKTARALRSVDRPNWTTRDKLTVRHPDASWITSTASVPTRENLIPDPAIEGALDWTAVGGVVTRVDTGGPSTGAWHMKLDKTTASGDPSYIWLDIDDIEEKENYEFSIASKLFGANPDLTLMLEVVWRRATGGEIRTDNVRTRDLHTGEGYERYRTGLLKTPDNTRKCTLRIRWPKNLPATSTVYVDDIMFEKTNDAGQAFFYGETADTADFTYVWSGAVNNSTSQQLELISEPVTIPAAETKTVDTLISSDKTKNVYNIGYFYTFYNEIGETSPSQATIVRVQRPWTSWRWEEPNGSGEPGGTETKDPKKVADQLVVFMPEDAFYAAHKMGALGWNLYMFAWSDQDSVPIEAVQIGQQELPEVSIWDRHGWIRHSPQASDYPYSAPLPNKDTPNYTKPSKAAQGIVAADRLVLVYDVEAAAVIRWTSNQQGDYINFSAGRGGGFKTLTSGNLMIPAAVKLWQNPQSADTLTILCMGTDGVSTGYYMAPAQIASQSDATNIMGFEETTATPGTVSPFGCEVLNNALYHPLDNELMKSTASNYNINHKSTTEAIENLWTRLLNKKNIVSSQLDNRIYFIVHNPSGALLEEGCMGNEIWVYDTVPEGGTWSRWLIQASSLRKIEVDSLVYMSVSRPDGLYYLDPNVFTDDYVSNGEGSVIAQRNIPWKLETNTQGANRAHDAWCHLQQANLIAGNFAGQMRYGIRSWDLHGRAVEKAKIVRSDHDPNAFGTWDLEDYLLIRKDLKEWYFFAESVTEDGVVQPSQGQLNLVQYRYTPVSVNVGYEYGSVETFEYGRAGNVEAQRTTDNGIPQPFVDTRRP